ncbi:thiol:disulfide interchange protein DsbA/DsbL [Parashewanella curva]|uniref:Thiol:disulfide interchange protein n=1 Tax=Parashewanella curva TaxID=2338552 RepID=A0A3L8PZK0_9GAMM|nr:thiol:disulfide interchange protein DsbA/DsbL [Parashewanella curva]RLV60580.1 thiol:disulfide interchange protein DsbA/DsbL [Parashewanella curva]
MKKFLLVAAVLLMFPLLSQAAQYKEGVHYSVIKGQQKTDKPEITEYFSFFCGHCYQFSLNVLPKLEKGLPAGVTFKQSHVDFIGGQMGQELSRAFAVAEQLGVEKKMEKAIFRAIHAQRQRLTNRDDVRKIFIANGVSGKDFDSAINSFMVNARVAQMRRAAQDAQINGVPDLVVNGVYKIEKGAIKSWDEYLAIAFWLAKNK